MFVPQWWLAFTIPPDCETDSLEGEMGGSSMFFWRGFHGKIVINFTKQRTVHSPPPIDAKDLQKKTFLKTRIEVLLESFQTRGLTELEGYVFYYLNGNKTIGLTKVKTAWYVMLRALREKVDQGFNSKKQKVVALQDKIAATHKRFRQIQTWIKFSNNYRNQWEVSSRS